MLAEVERQLAELGDRRLARAGVGATTARSSSRPTARRPCRWPTLAPEHLEVHAADEAW